MYYSIISYPFHDRGIFSDPVLPENVSFIKGEWIDWVPESPLVFKSNCDQSHPPRECMGGKAIPVWSEDLVDLFHSIGVQNIQTFPAVITGDNKDQWAGYFAVNIMGMLAAANISASSFTEIGSYADGLPMLGFEKLVIDRSKTNDQSLFRLAENRLELIAHQRVIDALKEHAPAGGWGFRLFPLTIPEKSSYHSCDQYRQQSTPPLSGTYQ